MLWQKQINMRNVVRSAETKSLPFGICSAKKIWSYQQDKHRFPNTKNKFDGISNKSGVVASLYFIDHLGANLNERLTKRATVTQKIEVGK